MTCLGLNFPLPYIPFPGSASPKPQEAILQSDDEFRPPLLLSEPLLLALVSNDLNYMQQELESGFISHLFSIDGGQPAQGSSVVKEINNIFLEKRSIQSSTRSIEMDIDHLEKSLEADNALDEKMGATAFSLLISHINTFKKRLESIPDLRSKELQMHVDTSLDPPTLSPQWPLDYPSGTQRACQFIESSHHLFNSNIARQSPGWTADEASTITSSNPNPSAALCEQISEAYYEVVIENLRSKRKYTSDVNLYHLVLSGLLFNPHHLKLRKLQEYWRAAMFLITSKARGFYYRNLFWVSSSVNLPNKVIGFGVGGGVCDALTVTKSAWSLDAQYLTGSDSYQFQVFGGVFPRIDQGLFPQYLAQSQEVVFQRAHEAVASVCRRRQTRRTIIITGLGSRHMQQLGNIIEKALDVGVEMNMLSVNDAIWHKYMNCEGFLSNVQSKRCWKNAMTLAGGGIPWSSMDENLNSEMPSELHLIRKVYQYAVDDRDSPGSDISFLVDSRFVSTLPLWVMPLGQVEVAYLMVEPSAALYLTLLNTENAVNIDDAIEIFVQYFSLQLKSLVVSHSDKSIHVSLIPHDPFDNISALFNEVKGKYLKFVDGAVLDEFAGHLMTDINTVKEDIADFLEVKELLISKIPQELQACYDTLMMSDVSGAVVAGSACDRYANMIDEYLDNV